MSRSKKLVTGAAIGVAIPAAVGAAKKLLDDGGKSGSKRSKPSSRTRQAATRARTTAARARKTATRATTKARPAKKRTTTSKRSATPTREQLYRQAVRLKIEGRSRMSKEQLQRAVKRVRSR